MTYTLCIKLFERGKLTADMCDVYFAANRLSVAEYNELIALLSTPDDEEPTEE